MGKRLWDLAKSRIEIGTILLQAYFLHTPVPESTLFVTRRKNSAEIEPWGAPRA